jgi:hypothetical protein
MPSRAQVETMPTTKHPSTHPSPCDEILVLKEKVAALEAWRASTEADLKEIRDVISQVKLLITLSIGGGGLSVITLIITISRMIHP